MLCFLAGSAEPIHAIIGFKLAIFSIPGIIESSRFIYPLPPQMKKASSPIRPKRRHPNRPRRVLLLLGSYYRSNHEGIARYAKERGWTLDDFFLGGGPLRYTFNVDGIIGLITTPKELEVLRQLPGVPLVDLSNAWGSEALPDPGGLNVPRVYCDGAEIGRVAANHFLGLGFKHIAFFNLGNFWHERMRLGSFEKTVREVGATFYEIPHYRWLAERTEPEPVKREAKVIKRLQLELKRMPKPLAVFTPTDRVGALVLYACAEAGLRVPSEVAVLGCHNEQLICEFTHIPLSSVDDNLDRQGYEAARLLEKIMNGEAYSTEPMILPVEKVVTRASTDFFMAERTEIRKALEFIKKNYREAIQIEDVAKAAGVAPRTLSQLFQTQLRTSMKKEITRIRIDRAKDLLRGTGMKAWEIATEAGFTSMEHLSRTFTRVVGENPSEYRQRHS